MKNVTVLDFSKIGYKQILSADEGIFDNKNSEWIFSNGRMITLDKGGNTTSIGFEKYFYPLGDGPLKVSKIPDDANEMTLSQAFEAKKIYKEITKREVLAVWLTIATKGFCFSEDIIVEGGCSVFQHCKMCVYVNATIAFSMYVSAAIILHDVCICW